MTINQFWDIIGRVHEAGRGDMKRKCELIGEELRKLSPEEVRSFGDYYTEFYYRAYREDLWDAAYLICGGCGDDSFMDFRHTLISMGREIFEKAMSNPDSLADLDLDEESASFEGYQYAIGHAYEDVMKRGGEVTEEFGSRGGTHPKSPAGTECNSWEMEKQFPRLTAKYGHKDADHLPDKERLERRNKEFLYTIIAPPNTDTKQGSLAELLMDSGIVTDSGWIPPLAVVARIIKEGKFVKDEKCCSWPAVALDENLYWRAILGLDPRGSGDLRQRWARIRVAKLQHDFTTPKTDDYMSWVRSLKERGLE
jgi:hypothetical protein